MTRASIKVSLIVPIGQPSGLDICAIGDTYQKIINSPQVFSSAHTALWSRNPIKILISDVPRMLRATRHWTGTCMVSDLNASTVRSQRDVLITHSYRGSTVTPYTLLLNQTAITFISCSHRGFFSSFFSLSSRSRPFDSPKRRSSVISDASMMLTPQSSSRYNMLGIQFVVNLSHN